MLPPLGDVVDLLRCELARIPCNDLVIICFIKMKQIILITGLSPATSYTTILARMREDITSSLRGIKKVYHEMDTLKSNNRKGLLCKRSLEEVKEFPNKKDIQ